MSWMASTAKREMPADPARRSSLEPRPASTVSTGRPRMPVCSLFRTSPAAGSTAWISSTMRQTARAHVAGGWRRRRAAKLAGSDTTDEPSRTAADRSGGSRSPLPAPRVEVRRKSAGRTVQPGAPSIASIMARTVSSSLYSTSRSSLTGTGPCASPGLRRTSAVQSRLATSSSRAVLPAPGAPWTSWVRPLASPSWLAGLRHHDLELAADLVDKLLASGETGRGAPVFPLDKPAQTVKIRGTGIHCSVPVGRSSRRTLPSSEAKT